ncbi:MAG: hypothetical protein V4773_11610 [Verrucomicrobiota bacterium]
MLFSLVAPAVHGGVASEWNEVLAQHRSLADVFYTPPLEARLHASMHLAMAEALRDAQGSAVRGRASEATQRAALAAAAEAIVVEWLPGSRIRAEALAARQLAGIPEGAEKAKGLACGRAAAARVLATRAGDRWIEIMGLSSAEGPVPDRSANEVQRLARGESELLSPWLAVAPLTLKSVEKIKVEVPAYTAMDGTVRVNYWLRESKLFAAVDRTVAPQMLAQTWSERPVVAWNRVAQLVAEGRGLGLEAETRLFATLNLALADATISALHWRYTLGSWRTQFVQIWGDARTTPVGATDILAPAMIDGINGGTARAEMRRMLIPPLINYPSVTATLAGAAQAAMIECLKGDRTGFTIELGGGSEPRSRSFGGIEEAARESALVATFDGRHTREAAIAGHKLGLGVGREAAKRFASGR